MSVTYDIRCEKCKRYLWIGQRAWIYTGKDYVNRLSRFLFLHKGHGLIFEDDTWREKVGCYDDDNYGGWINFEEEDIQYMHAFEEAPKAENERLEDKES